MENPTDPRPRRTMRTGLIIFGSLSLGLGVLCLLLIPLMVLGSFIPVKGQEPTPLSMILQAASFYLLIAIVDIWLGIGSIRCQRWARSLLLLWSLFWLFCGSVSLLVFGLMSGELDATMAQSGAQMPEGFARGFKLAMFVILGLVYVVLPASFVWFYSLRDTRLTCEERHPSPSWTDRCPLSVLGLALLAWMWALSLPVLLAYGPLFPFFGSYLEGIPATLVILLLSALFIRAGWGLYQLKKAYWGFSLGLTLLLLASYAVTFSQAGLMEFYRHMNMPDQTLKMLEASPFLKSRWIEWGCLAFALPYLGWMFSALKYFKNPRP